MGISLDLSKALHPKVWDSLAAFMPGLFFEICILLGNPHAANALIQPPLDRTLAIIVAMPLAFIIGNAFMLWVAFIQATLGFLLKLSFKVVSPLWGKFLQHLVRARGMPPRVTWLGNRRFIQLAFRRSLNDNGWQAAFNAWRQVASAILRHYNLQPPHDFGGWRPWSGVLGYLKREDIRGYSLMVASHATGWSGLAAINFAPKLRMPYFLWFCFFSITLGLFHDWTVSYRLAHPSRSWTLGLRRAMEELKSIHAITEKQQEENAEPEKSGSLNGG